MAKGLCAMCGRPVKWYGGRPASYCNPHQAQRMRRWRGGVLGPRKDLAVSKVHNTPVRAATGARSESVRNAAAAAARVMASAFP